MLTQKQADVLKFIRRYYGHNQQFPSIRQIGQHFSLSERAVQQHVMALKKKGALEDHKPVTASYTLPELADVISPIRIPILGAIAAGAPAPALDDPDAYIQLEPHFFSKDSGDVFALKVTGDSMTGDCICDGDIAIIHQRLDRLVSEIVAVRIGADEFSLKRVQVKGDKITLLSSNPAYSPMTYPKDQVEVVGRLVGLIRRQ